MAIERKWINRTMGALSGVILALGLLQVSLNMSVNQLYPVYSNATAYVQSVNSFDLLLNSGIELIGLAVLAFPTIWLGIAAAISRNRSVYILLTILSCFCVLMVIGFIVYEAYVFSTNRWFTFPESRLQGLVITKITIWCIMLLLCIVHLAIAIAADCSRAANDFKYISYNTPAPMPYLPEYSTKPSKEYANYPRQVMPAPVRYSDYPMAAVPRMYYPYKHY